MSREDLRHELIALERSFWESAGDPQFYRENFADDGVMAFNIGTMGKDEVVASMQGAPEWANYTIDEPVLVQLGPDAASLTYTTVAQPPGNGDVYRAALTSVYVRRDGRWLLAVHQQTPLHH
ncbi:MAG TPA: nuclear transport factor 2 family protein [Acidimicrobiia bacterium]|nr:nuclear transport factor 2 family protein [Acidimicrobiia bacterium]